MRVAIIGAGLIGQKRAGVIAARRRDKVLWVADIDKDKAEFLAERIGAKASKDWKVVVSHRDVETVIVATTHDWLALISHEALKNGKHVLCEKPMGINSKDIARNIRLAKRKGLIYKGGYNHRFHPAIFKSYQLFNQDRIGKLMYIKARYGHGGRPGYEKEWRMNQIKSGGGEMIDQGAHLIDLVGWFMGKITRVEGKLLTTFWPIKPLEDNVFLMLENSQGLAWLHASWTEWKNQFLLEIYGQKGYLKVVGLGGSYGLEKLILGKRVPGKAPLEKEWSYEQDISWQKEWQNFCRAVAGKEKLVGSGEDGLRVVEVVEQMYQRPIPR